MLKWHQNWHPSTHTGWHPSTQTFRFTNTHSGSHPRINIRFTCTISGSHPRIQIIDWIYIQFHITSSKVHIHNHRLNLRLLLVLIVELAGAATILLLVAIAGLSNSGCLVFLIFFATTFFFVLPFLFLSTSTVWSAVGWFEPLLDLHMYMIN